MVTGLTTDLGEEYLVDNQPDGDTLTLILFSDAADNLQETDDLADLTSEPDAANSYARQTSTVSTGQLSGSGAGDFGLSNDATVTFTLDTNTETIDAVGFVATFQSSVEGDVSATEHLIGADELAVEYPLAEFNELTIEYQAGRLEHVVTGTAP